MSSISHLAFCDRLEPILTRFADTLDGADFATPVPSCGDDWNLRDLAEHLGSLHRWVERMVHERAPRRIVRSEMDIVVPPDAELAAWLRAGIAPLLAALRDCPPDAPMWAWGADQHARFWSRRQVHEGYVHLLDAEWALGREPMPIEADLAADGVDEFLENTPCAAYWAPRLREICGKGERLVLHATDCEADWTITLTPEGYAWSRGASGDAVVQVDAPAESLYLLLWARRTLADAAFTTHGDAAALEFLLDRFGDL